MVEAQSQRRLLEDTFRGPFLLFFRPGTRSCALKDAQSQTLFSFCSTPRPMTSLVLTVTQATAKSGKPRLPGAEGRRAGAARFKKLLMMGAAGRCSGFPGKETEEPA